MPALKNRNGQRIGRLLVIGLTHKVREKWFWLCKCDCGRFTTVVASNLSSGHSKSCGCWRVDAPHNLRLIADRPAKRSPEYNIFAGAKQRCTDSNHEAYHHYGGRGIEFRFKSFHDFIDALGWLPSPEYTVNRIDNDGHYEHGNVEWATSHTQSRNRRNNHRVTAHGFTKIMADWAIDTGIADSCIRDRLKRGWCDECSVTILSGQGVCSHKLSLPAAEPSQS